MITRESDVSDGELVDLGPIHNLNERIPADRARYVHLRTVIRDLIENGIWPVGGKLPSEANLARLTGLSLGTVQRALRELSEACFLSRQQGRGTFVSLKSLELDEPLHCRFASDEENGYASVFTKLLSRGRCATPGPFLHLFGEVADDFVYLERLINISREFTVHSLLLFPRPRYSALLNIPSEAFNSLNIKKLLYQELGVSVRRISQRLRIRTNTPGIARHIGVEPGSPGLQMQTAGFSEEDAVIYGQELSIPATDRWLVVNNMSLV